MVSIETVETPSLGDRSYLLTAGQAAVVIDPQRDIDRFLAMLVERGLSLTHVLETHIHNDYVSGGLELARCTGASYVVPAGAGAAFGHVPAADGDIVGAGALKLRTLHTPGHTHHHVSYALEPASGRAGAVFTGGSLLFGATGRTDLVSPADTEGLTRDQYASVRRIAAELPPDTAVYPTHGFGSFCSATPTSGDSSTIDHERQVNPALTLSEHEYVESLLAGLDAYPAYYVHMGPINRAGPAPVDLTLPAPVVPQELRRRIGAGEWVVDLRARTAFAAGHLAETINIELGDSFATYLGWLYRWGAPLTLIGETEQQVVDARRELVRIGIDRLAGMAVGGLAALADTHPVRSYRVSDFAALAEARRRGEAHVLDARRNNEWAAGHVAGAQHIPLHELADRVSEVPTGEVWIYCASGYRASIAASILDRPGREVVVINEDYSAAAKAGLEQPASAQSVG